MSGTSQGAAMIRALKARLQTITAANGYPLTVKTVEVFKGQITFNLPASILPMIEIIQTGENYDVMTAGNVDVYAGFALRLVQPQSVDDEGMEDFKGAVVRCIYANSYNAANRTNAGIGLAEGGVNTIVYPRVVRCQTDLNMVPANRIWALQFEFKMNRNTYSF
jgi:hypothetical protein